MKVLSKGFKFSPVVARGFAPKYNWASLCDGKCRQLDLSDIPAGMEVAKFRSGLRKAAAKLGHNINFEVLTDDDGNDTGCVVQSSPMSDAEKSAYKAKVDERKAAKKAKKAAKAAATATANGDADEPEEDEPTE